MDKHDALSRLKNLAIELGRTPTRDEFAAGIRNGKDVPTQLFGSYNTMVQAAGLEPNYVRKVTNRVFEKSIEQHVNGYQPQATEPPPQYPTIATISDIHFPFPNKRVLEAFYRFCERHKPEYIILNGDAWDMYSHAKFPRTHNMFTPREEQGVSRKMNEEFWREVKLASVESQCVQMLGNHDVRPLKRIIEEYPEAEDWVRDKLQALFTFDGVRTIHDVREELILPGNIATFHGYRSKLGEHRDYTLMNCINGHTHQGGVSFRKIRGQVLWELNSGLAGDPYAKGLTYTAQKITHWTEGFGAVHEDGPRFIPA